MYLSKRCADCVTNWCLLVAIVAIVIVQSMQTVLKWSRCA